MNYNIFSVSIVPASLGGVLCTAVLYACTHTLLSHWKRGEGKNILFIIYLIKLFIFIDHFRYGIYIFSLGNIFVVVVFAAAFSLLSTFYFLN